MSSMNLMEEFLHRKKKESLGRILDMKQNLLGRALIMENPSDAQVNIFNQNKRGLEA